MCHMYAYDRSTSTVTRVGFSTFSIMSSVLSFCNSASSLGLTLNGILLWACATSVIVGSMCKSTFTPSIFPILRNRSAYSFNRLLVIVSSLWTVFATLTRNSFYTSNIMTWCSSMTSCATLARLKLFISCHSMAFVRYSVIRSLGSGASILPMPDAKDLGVTIDSKLHLNSLLQSPVHTFPN